MGPISVRPPGKATADAVRELAKADWDLYSEYFARVMVLLTDKYRPEVVGKLLGSWQLPCGGLAGELLR